MAKTKSELLSEITIARQQLSKLERHVAALEASLSDLAADQSLDSVVPGSQDYDRTLGLLVEGIKDYAIYLLDTNGCIVNWNTGAESLKGYRRSEVIGASYARFFTAENQQTNKPQRLLTAAELQGRFEDEDWYVRKDGTRFWANTIITALRNPNGSFYGFTVITRDLTDRKSATDLIRRLNRTLGVLSDINQAIIRIRHLPRLFETACKIAVEKGAFRMAWIGLVDAQAKRMNPIASAGFSDDYLEKLNIVITDDDPRGQGPGATSIRIGHHVVIDSIETDPRMAPWREDALRLGYRSVGVFPLIVAGEVRGAFSLYATEPDFFNDDEIRLLDEMAMDISFAMVVAAQEAHREAAELAIHGYSQQLEILHQIDVGIIEATSIHAVVESAIKHVRELIPCERVAVILFDWAAEQWLIFADDSTRPYSIGREMRYPIPPGWDEGFGTEKTRIIDDLRLIDNPLPVYKQLIQDGLLSGIQALFMDQGRVTGLLGLNASTPGFFTIAHETIAGQIADQLTIAIRQIQLTEALARHVQTTEEAHHFLQSTLDAFPANTAVLAPDGTILTVNLPWKQFAYDNDSTAEQYLAVNYLTTCDSASGLMAAEAALAAAGIRAVIAGQQDEFTLEYPCNSPTENRWFMLRVTPFAELVPRRVVLAHLNITSLKAVEESEREQRRLAEALRDSLAALTTSSDMETVMFQILAYSASVIPSEAGSIILFEGDHSRFAR